MASSEVFLNASRTVRFGQHSNAFGSLRLLFASLVIISHAPEIFHGNRDNEPLTWLFGSISLGDLAVDGFFLISGYLITASFLNSRTSYSYLKKRVARIYPGFLCAYFVCVLIVAPIGGATMPDSPGEFASVMVRALLLQPPDVGTVFNGTPFPFLNTSMWTISIEFKCYLLIYVIGLLGLLKIRKLILVAAIAFLIANMFVELDHQSFNMGITERPAPDVFSFSEWNTMLLGNKKGWLRLTAVFLTGSCIYHYRDMIVFKPIYIVISTALLALCLCFDWSAHLGVALFGAYLIFAAAEMNRGNVFSRINNETDISYGVYLYAWPVTKILFLFFPALSVPQVSLLTLVISYLLGWMSWMIVEKPVMMLLRAKSAFPVSVGDSNTVP
jgi:peptidoglycan/LPS O-acetylase OafA/YrhL